MMFLLIVTLISMLLAAIMSAVAWRIAGDERRRSEARVAALAAGIHGVPPAPVAAQPRAGRRAEIGIRAEPPRLKSMPAVARPRQRWDEELELRPGGAPIAADLFAAPPSRSGSQWIARLGVGALVFGTAVAIAILVGGGSSTAARSANQVAVTAPTELPLELVALGHERMGDRLTVRGVVRTPAAGGGRERLTAVVFVFARDGGFLASGRAAVDSPALSPGGESTFIVTVPGASEVGRYRVSFRTDDQIVPHVDRRHER